ncbi:hypothetical protein ACWENO_10805 [Streptomyces sp. NPDC004436]
MRVETWDRFGLRSDGGPPWERFEWAAGFSSAGGRRLPCPAGQETIGTLIVEAAA